MIRTTNHTIFFSLLLAGAVLLGALVHQLNAAQRAQLVTQLQETQTVLRATEVAQDVSLQQTNVSAAVQQTVTAHAPLLATQVVDLVVGTQQVVQATHIRERDIQATKVSQDVHLTQVSLSLTQVREESTRIARAVQATVSAMPTSTPVPTLVPSPTATPEKAQVNLRVLGCGPSLSRPEHGEVTYAYVEATNVGRVDVRDVVVSLAASDRGRHESPDETETLQYLPAGQGAVFTLKVDTILGQRTDIEVTLTANDGVRETAKQADCRDLNQEELEALASIIGKVLPIPGLPGIGR